MFFSNLYVFTANVVFYPPKNAVSSGQGQRQLRTNELFSEHSPSEKLKAIRDFPTPLNIGNWYN